MKAEIGTYNGEFAQCRTRTGLEPEDIETIVFEEEEKIGAYKAKRFLQGKINFTKNNPKHLAKLVLHEIIPTTLRSLKRRSLSSHEKARLERERKIAMNQFNI